VSSTLLLKKSLPVHIVPTLQVVFLSP